MAPQVRLFHESANINFQEEWRRGKKLSNCRAKCHYFTANINFSDAQQKGQKENTRGETSKKETHALVHTTMATWRSRVRENGVIQRKL